MVIRGSFTPLIAFYFIFQQTYVKGLLNQPLTGIWRERMKSLARNGMLEEDFSNSEGGQTLDGWHAREETRG
jgi:hypothetical protein